MYQICIHWDGEVVRVTALVFTEACLQCLQWIPGLSTWRLFRSCYNIGGPCLTYLRLCSRHLWATPTVRRLPRRDPGNARSGHDPISVLTYKSCKSRGLWSQEQGVEWGGWGRGIVLLCSICGLARSRPMRKDVTNATLLLICWNLLSHVIWNSLRKMGPAELSFFIPVILTVLCRIDI